MEGNPYNLDIPSIPSYKLFHVKRTVPIEEKQEIRGSN